MASPTPVLQNDQRLEHCYDSYTFHLAQRIVEVKSLQLNHCVRNLPLHRRQEALDPELLSFKS